MRFPGTRATLIKRLASGGTDNDWSQFLADYWGPLCGFASRWGRLSADDAEDVTAQVFVILWECDLFARWHTNRTAKLRTLLCGVARRVIANRSRVAAGRKEILAKLAQQFPDGTSTWKTEEPTQEELNTFYAAWADDVLRQSLDNLLGRCQRDGKEDHFRVVYARLCEGLAMRQIAAALGIEVVTAENFLKTSKAQLKRELQFAVAAQLERYTEETNRAEQFAEDWNELSEHLSQHGGLERTVRESYLRLGDEPWASRKSDRIEAAKTEILRGASDGHLPI